VQAEYNNNNNNNNNRPSPRVHSASRLLLVTSSVVARTVCLPSGCSNIRDHRNTSSRSIKPWLTQTRGGSNRATIVTQTRSTVASRTSGRPHWVIFHCVLGRDHNSHTSVNSFLSCCKIIVCFIEWWKLVSRPNWGECCRTWQRRVSAFLLFTVCY